MKITHHGIQLDELRDDWWSAAEMHGFVPRSRAYNVRRSNEQIVEVSIEDVSPLLRKPLFRDSIDEGISVDDRVVSILRGFRLGESFLPVEIAQGDAPYRYRLTQGAHRFYCSLAVGFSHVPAIIRLDATWT
jgi:hypothetical protein